MSESHVPRVTYLSLGSSPELDAAFEAALASVRGRFGEVFRGSEPGATTADPVLDELRSPIDRRWVVARTERSSVAAVERAVATAQGAFVSWRARDWQERAAILRRAADLIVARRLELAAWMVYEIGKTRLEALAEVEESADLLRYYCDRIEAADGYRQPMARLAPAEATESVLLPYGVWAVIAPFNFPAALAAGMLAGALVTGNTTVFKPAEAAPVSGALLCQALWDAGVPREALALLFGPGEPVGRAMVEHPDVAGIAFTGSYEVGMGLVRSAARDWPRPVVAEMGGKNACVVTRHGDLDAAAAGVARSAFGFGGQKCSACSRVYVEQAVYQPFLDRLLAETASLAVGSPLDRGTFCGPVIDARAVARYLATLEAVRAAGGEILAGGRVHGEGDRGHGFYVEPTVARLPDAHHRLFAEELFLPFVLVHPVTDLDAGVAEANRSRFGLTAGLFSRDAAEVERFLATIEAGVIYVNRRSGATTGAWPGVNPFGGWKGSGSTGPAALGPHYLLKFLREQSRAVSGVSGTSGVGA
jgi:1-pyrroline-5-carboxylate dehydrogenase